MQRRNFLWCFLLFTTSCSATTRIFSSQAQVEMPVEMPEVLRFAVNDAKGIQELERDYEPFRVALAEVLQTQIEFFPVEDILAVAPAMLSGRVDLAWVGPSEYVLLHARAQAIPVVMLNRRNYHTVIVISADSKIKTLTDLKGKTIDVWRIGGGASHLGAVKLLLDAGIDSAEVNIIALNESSLQKLTTGEVDAQSMSLAEYHKRLQTDELPESKFSVLAQGPPLSGDVFVTSSQVSLPVTEAIRSRMLQQQGKLLQALSSVETLSKFRGATISPATDADFDDMREVYRAIGQEEVIQ